MKRQSSKKDKSLIKKVEVYASIAANLVTALAGTGAFFLYLWSVHATYIKERDPQFSGHWSTFAEGCINCPLDKNDKIIKLNIEADNGEISGEIYIDDPFGEETEKKTKKTSKELMADLAKSYTNWFMVEGDLTFYHGTIRLFDYRQGQKTYFGKANIKLINNSLYLETEERSYDTIPQEAVFSTVIEEPKKTDQVKTK